MIISEKIDLIRKIVFLKIFFFLLALIQTAAFPCITPIKIFYYPARGTKFSLAKCNKADPVFQESNTISRPARQHAVK